MEPAYKRLIRPAHRVRGKMYAVCAPGGGVVLDELYTTKAKAEAALREFAGTMNQANALSTMKRLGYRVKRLRVLS